jgi:hypothetical protein
VATENLTAPRWRELARTDPERALQALSNGWNWAGHTAGRDRARAELQAEIQDTWSALARNRPAVAIRIAVLLSAEERRPLFREIGLAWDCLAASDPMGAIVRLSQLKAAEARALQSALGEVWARASEPEPRAALEALGRLPADERLRVRPAVLSAWRRLAREEPEQAVETIEHLDAAERAEVGREVVALWPVWAAASAEDALSGLAHLRDEERRSVSAHVPLVWRALAERDPSQALRRLLRLLPSERVQLAADVVRTWRRVLEAEPELVLRELPWPLEPEEAVELVADLQDAWRRSNGGPEAKLYALQHLSTRVRAGLAGEVQALWWAAAKEGVHGALRIRNGLTLDERAGLPRTAAVLAFSRAEPLPEGTAPEVEEDVRRLWRLLGAGEALEWLVKAKAPLRELIPEAEVGERWEHLLCAEPKRALLWLANVPKRLHPELDEARLGRLLTSESAEARLWAISQVSAAGGKRPPSKRTGRGEQADRPAAMARRR